MVAGSGRPAAKSLLDILIGLHTGVIGGLVMLGWFAMISPLLGKPWWLIPNLLASGMLDQRHVLEGAGFTTLAGGALQVVTAGIVGAINGILTPGGRLFGLAVAAGWYLLCYLFVWKRVAPGLLAYGSQPVIIAGYFLYGSILGWHGHLVAHSRE